MSRLVRWLDRIVFITRSRPSFDERLSHAMARTGAVPLRSFAVEAQRARPAALPSLIGGAEHRPAARPNPNLFPNPSPSPRSRGRR